MIVGDNIRKNIAFVISLCWWLFIRVGGEGRKVWKGEEAPHQRGLATGSV